MIKIVETHIPVDFPNFTVHNEETLKIAYLIKNSITTPSIVVKEDSDIINIVEMVEKDKDFLKGKTLILAGLLYRRRTMSKISTLLTYLMAQDRKYRVTFIVLIDSIIHLDLRVRNRTNVLYNYITGEEKEITYG